MAATKLIAMHQNKGMSVQKCLKDRTDYAKMMRRRMTESTFHPMSAILICRSGIFAGKEIIFSDNRQTAKG